MPDGRGVRAHKDDPGISPPHQGVLLMVRARQALLGTKWHPSESGGNVPVQSSCSSEGRS